MSKKITIDTIMIIYTPVHTLQKFTHVQQHFQIVYQCSVSLSKQPSVPFLRHFVFPEVVLDSMLSTMPVMIIQQEDQFTRITVL